MCLIRRIQFQRVYPCCSPLKRRKYRCCLNKNVCVHSPSKPELLWWRFHWLRRQHNCCGNNSYSCFNNGICHSNNLVCWGYINKRSLRQQSHFLRARYFYDLWKNLTYGYFTKHGTPRCRFIWIIQISPFKTSRNISAPPTIMQFFKSEIKSKSYTTNGLIITAKQFCVI